MQPGDEVWCQSLHRAPFKGVLLGRNDEAGRVVVVVHHGFEVVTTDQCFASEGECLIAAATVRRKEGMKYLNDADALTERFQNFVSGRPNSEPLQ